MQKLYATPLRTVPAHCPCRREKHACLGAFTAHRRGVAAQPNTALKSPLSGDFLFYHKGIYLDGIFLYR